MLEDGSIEERAGARSGTFHKFLNSWSLLWAVVLLISAGLVVYAETIAFVWDEGFHVVAAQLISWGKTPYIDFLFPQTLLNAYFNAAVLRSIGHSWHALHFFDALFVVGTMCLTTTYAMRRFPDRRWALPCSIVVACLVGLDTVVIPFGTVAQAYGSGTFFVVAAFCIAIRSIDSKDIWLPFLTGLLAGAAAGCTLLTAPVIPVLVVWIVITNRAGSRWAKGGAFCVGSLIPFTPEFWLLFKAPAVTFFNVVQYQALFRRVNWGDVGLHDLDIFTDWTTSAHSLLLGLFALIGIVFVIKKSNWNRALRSEIYLAAWIAAGLGTYIGIAHPTFGRYFIFIVPFMAILSSAGFYYAASQLMGRDRPWWPTVILVFILTVSAGKYVFDERDSTNWHDYEKIAAKIKEVTPPGKEYWADELVYFILRQAPPSGLEFSYSHKLELSPLDEARYHIISLKELKEQVSQGRFATVETCKDDIETDFKLDDLFANKQDFEDCTVYWGMNKRSK
jgi:hypothetical protein